MSASDGGSFGEASGRTAGSTSSYAGIVSRLAALATDVTVLMLASIAVGSLPRMAWQQLIIRPVPEWLTTGSAALAALLPWMYFTAGWWLSGQTVGNRLFGIAVQDRHGQVPSFAQSASRAAVGLWLAPIWLLGLLNVLWDERRRAWHDRLFGTVVRYTEKRKA
jgi:uncharacterized RDD family membrane protein YckC